MCTLIFGIGVLGPGTLLLGANRDEDPGRPSDSPRVLSDAPLVVGGRDRIAGGTWLAVRQARSVVAVLNRHDLGAARSAGPVVPAPDTVPLRSRGLLALDIARLEPALAPEGFARTALLETQSLIRERRYAPFTLACLTPESSWVLSRDGSDPAAVTHPETGWHVVTHAALDDPAEPRTAWLQESLAGFRPASALEAEARLLELLSHHGSAAPSGAAPTGSRSALASTPAVCIHEGRMVTVSTSVFTHAGGQGRYLHLEGRPCNATPQDLSSLLHEPSSRGR